MGSAPIHTRSFEEDRERQVQLSKLKEGLGELGRGSLKTQNTWSILKALLLALLLEHNSRHPTHHVPTLALQQESCIIASWGQHYLHTSTSLADILLPRTTGWYQSKITNSESSVALHSSQEGEGQTDCWENNDKYWAALLECCCP